MSDPINKPDPSKIDKIAADILRPVGMNIKFHIWMGFLTVLLLFCLFQYGIQLQKGLIVTGLRDFVSWGMYISNFVFFVASSLVGMLISAVLGLIGYQWIKPITRLAEIIAFAFAAVAGLVIISDMGRPDRLPYVFMYGRVQSPILWDITVVTTYMVISFLLYFIPMIPDLAISKTRLQNQPRWLVAVYDFLSFKWTHHPEQYKIMFRAVRALLILVIPTAFAIHTVTSWLFAVTPRPGWDSTIFGPYFISGAFVAGSSALIIAMFVFRKSYKLENYITDEQFNNMGKLLFLVAAVYLYFNVNEFFVPAYKMKRTDALHLDELFYGRYAIIFWSVQILGLILPMLFMLIKKMRKPLPLLIISLFVFVGSWVKRLIIVVPTMEHPYLPKEHVPAEWMFYKPTFIESCITLASFILVLIIITVLSKFFPLIPIWEMAEDEPAHKEKTANTPAL
jgi:molybdopterin-containing oxidoreductase family membrane subunit